MTASAPPVRARIAVSSGGKWLIVDFLKLILAAFRAARSVQSHREPSADTLARLGIDPASMPAKL